MRCVKSGSIHTITEREEKNLESDLRQNSYQFSWDLIFLINCEMSSKMRKIGILTPEPNLYY